jgi:DNA helicase-2/ATP-dependent DNA helicase PcrA
MVLNPVQRDAVLYNEGPQLIFAGAGTGKTRVLTAKIAYLIDNGIAPGQIFAATFTNKAAREMRSRVESLMGIPVNGLWIGTFHSLCARILRMEGRSIGYDPAFTIYDSDDQLSLIKKILKSLDIDDRSITARQAAGFISRYKNLCMTVEDVQSQTRGFYEQEISRIYKLYQKLLREQQAMDFDDLLSNTVFLFRNNPELLQRYQRLFKHILVDEYQDTNTAQFLIVKELCALHGNIFVVGDDDQSIYGWRGAQIDNILSFEKIFPNTGVFKLEQNYRSCKNILKFANAVIAANDKRAPKQLWTERNEGEPVQVCRYRDDRQEAQAIAEKITNSVKGKIRGGDVAVLFRTNAQSRAFEEAFRRLRIPYILVGGISFYERAEIKDCLAYLRLLVNPRDDLSFDRIYNVPARGLGEKAHEQLSDYAKKSSLSLLQSLLSVDVSTLGSRYQKGFSELKSIFELLIDLHEKGASVKEILNEVLQLTGYVDILTREKTEDSLGRLENINELLNAVTIWSLENPGKKLSDFLEEVSLVSDIDSWEKKENAVNLMTLHCAKGLEFKHVYLVGLEDGIIPSKQNFDDESKIEEERRLLYVGVTRAMEKLECSYVDQRWRFGTLFPGIPSRFLQNLSPGVYIFKDNSSFFGQIDSSVEKKVTKRSDISKPGRSSYEMPGYEDFSQETVEFRMGQYVQHKSYGRGRILSISGFGDDMKLTVLFNDGVRRKLMAKFANFEN